MMTTVWAEVRDGRIVPLEELGLTEGAKVLVTVLDDGDEGQFWLGASQESLAAVWDNDQESEVAAGG